MFILLWFVKLPVYFECQFKLDCSYEICAYEHVNLKEYIIVANHLMSVVGFSNVRNVKYKTIFWIFNIMNYYKRKISLFQYL